MANPPDANINALNGEIFLARFNHEESQRIMMPKGFGFTDKFPYSDPDGVDLQDMLEYKDVAPNYIQLYHQACLQLSRTIKAKTFDRLCYICDHDPDQSFIFLFTSSNLDKVFAKLIADKRSIGRYCFQQGILEIVLDKQFNECLEVKEPKQRKAS